MSSSSNFAPVTFKSHVDARSEVELLRRLCQAAEHNLIMDSLVLFRSYVFGKEGSWVFNSALLPMTKHILANGEQYSVISSRLAKIDIFHV